MNELAPQQIQRVLHDEKASAWRRYALLTVGRACPGRLLLYEVLTGLFAGMPGASGYAARRLAYRALLGRMGRKVTIGRHVVLRGAARIALGDRVALDDNVVLDARGEGARIEIEDGVLISRNTIVRARDGVLRIGAGSDIGANCIAATDSRLDIGRDVLVAAYAYLVAGGNHRYDDPDTPILRQGFVSRGGVKIEDNVWIGAHTVVMDGVTIGAGSVVGAQSLVNSSLPPRSVAWGSPARVRKSR